MYLSVMTWLSQLESLMISQFPSLSLSSPWANPAQDKPWPVQRAGSNLEGEALWPGLESNVAGSLSKSSRHCFKLSLCMQGQGSCLNMHTYERLSLKERLE